MGEVDLPVLIGLGVLVIVFKGIMKIGIAR